MRYQFDTRLSEIFSGGGVYYLLYKSRPESQKKENLVTWVEFHCIVYEYLRIGNIGHFKGQERSCADSEERGKPGSPDFTFPSGLVHSFRTLVKSKSRVRLTAQKFKI